MDARLRELCRQSGLDPDDACALYRLRINYLRVGDLQQAGLAAGDVVLVDERESPWVRTPWEGEVTRVFEEGDAYVRPVNAKALEFRLKPSAEYLAKGLYLTREDVVTLTTPTQNAVHRDLMFHYILENGSRSDTPQKVPEAPETKKVPTHRVGKPPQLPPKKSRRRRKS